MRASPLALFALLLAGGTVLSAAEQVPKLEIDSRSWQNDDWAPGEGQSYTSDSASDDSYECNWIGEADTTDCTITPNTPQTPPPVAPDNCIWYDHTYDIEIYANFGCG